MPSPQWETVKNIVYDALSEPPHSWPEFLDRRCGDDLSLRSEVELLLKAYDTEFLESSVLERSEPAPPALKPGSDFSHYEIVKLLGRGGMGEVYLARDKSLDRSAAIKIIHADAGLGQKAAARLLREARAVARLQHPGICSVYEVGEADGMPFISMQYIEGSTLQDRMAGRAIDPKTAFTFARQIAEALDTAHQYGIIHRDVKPANVMIDAVGKLKVLDFGLAKETFPGPEGVTQTATGMIAGTVQYMSPEHLRGKTVNAQTDIWSLGVVLYQMLTGRLPFAGDTKADLISSILNDTLEPVSGLTSVNERAVNHVIRRALSKEQEERYQTIGEFCEDLRQLESTGNVIAVRKERSAKRTGARFPHLRRWALAAFTLISVAAVSGFLFWNKPATRANAFAEPSGKPFRITTAYSVKRKGDAGVMDLSYSPDGTRIAFVLSEPGTQSVQVLRIADQSVVQVTAGELNAGTPVWSPDGEHIAFATKASGKYEVWAVPASGGAPTTLARFDDASDGPELRKWSNDGSQIFFEDQRGPQTIEIGTGQTQQIDTAGLPGKIGRGFSVSRDDSAILVPTLENGNRQLWFKSLNSGDAHIVSTGALIKGPPQFFPEDRTFAYSADDGDAYQVYFGSLDGSSPQALTSGTLNATNPIVSPGGETIAYISKHDEANVFRTDLATEHTEAVTDRVQMQIFPTISSDGSSVAYEAINDPIKMLSGQLKVVTTRADGTRVDTEIPGGGHSPRWLAGSGRLAFVRGARDAHIWIYNTAEGTQRQVAQVPLTLSMFALAPVEFDRWPFEPSPDGSRFAYLRRTPERDELRIVNAEETGGDGLVVPLEKAPARIRGMKWSGDGSQLAFSMSERSDQTLEPGKGRLMLLRGGQTFQLAEFETTVRVIGWSPSDDAVYVALEESNGLKVVSVPVGGAGVRQLTTLSYAKPTGIVLSPDRRHVGYSVIRDGIYNVCVTRLASGRERCLTSNSDPTVFYSGTTWAPDSQSVLYSRQSGRMQIELLSRREKENEK